MIDTSAARSGRLARPDRRRQWSRLWLDGFGEFKVDHLDVPLTPVKIWQALQGNSR
jgi:hypothetical protein